MFIYFIQGVEGGPVKIGISTSVKSRMKQIQAFSPVKLHLIACVRGTYQDEVVFHRRFKECRLHGEWFEPVDELINLTKELGVQQHGAVILEPHLRRD